MSANPTLIVIHGAPASGKTHFSQWLSQQLDLPLLSKDDIKEELFNHFEYNTTEHSKQLGAASFDLLWLWLTKLMPFHSDLIIETAFFAKYSQPKIVDLLQTYSYNCIQVFCLADETIRQQRYLDRAKGPHRHPGHQDQNRADEFAAINNYHPMDLPGQTITLATTDLEHLDYQSVLQQIKLLL